MSKKNDVEAQVLGISFFSNNKAELLKELTQKALLLRSTTYIFTPNPEQLIQAKSNLEFKASLEQADIRIPDGMGVVWASRILSWRHKSAPLSQRISGTDLATDLLQLAAVKNWRVLLIGGKNYQPQVDKKEWNISWLKGYEQVSRPTMAEEAAVTNEIMKLRPEIVMVAFGAPAQEIWALGHRELMEKSGVKIVMVVGGAFDYLFHQVPRAPHFLQQLGFEWLYRLVQQPWRWKRQLRLLKFIWLVGKEAIT
jgi:N-acetylglucosaminyldiphosphoundecaprenol N-acetyl-beta-D-mannosaminyltransferase